MLVTTIMKLVVTAKVALSANTILYIGRTNLSMGLALGLLVMLVDSGFQGRGR